MAKRESSKDKRTKKKAMIAIWSDNKKSSFNEENQSITKLCLMAQEDEIQFEHILDFIFDELQEVFHELFEEFKKISQKNKDLRLKN